MRNGDPCHTRHGHDHTTYYPEPSGVTTKGFSAATRRTFDEWIGNANRIDSTRFDARKVRYYCQWKANI